MTSYKQEFIISHDTSKEIFAGNTPIDFKSVLDTENTYRFKDVGMRIKKVYCIFKKENLNNNNTPGIICSKGGEINEIIHNLQRHLDLGKKITDCDLWCLYECGQ